MKRISYKLYSGLVVLMLLLASGQVTAQDQERIMDMEKREVIKSDAMDAKMAFMRANPKLESMLKDAAGYAIFPNVGKGAWILGGAAGNGIVYENGQVAGYTELRQIDVGFQFGGSASAVIWDEGAGGAITFENGAGVAIMPKAGAMAGISVGGQEFDYRAAQ